MPYGCKADSCAGRFSASMFVFAKVLSFPSLTSGKGEVSELVRFQLLKSSALCGVLNTCLQDRSGFCRSIASCANRLTTWRLGDREMPARPIPRQRNTSAMGLEAHLLAK